MTLRYPPLTPPAVRRAVGAYVAARRLSAVTSILLAGAAAALAVLLLSMVLDRLFELPQGLRAAGPPLVGAIALATGLAIIASLLRYRPRALPTAIELDAALPANVDRWATSLDLAGRLQAGETLAARGLVDAVLADAQRDARSAAAVRLVSPRAALAWLAALLLLLAFAGALSQSAAVDPALLWRRFWNPAANLPRDADVVITLAEANGQPFAGALAPIPENTPFDLTIAIHRKGGWFELRRPAPPSAASLTPDDPLLQGEPPALEALAARGAARRDLVYRAGKWHFTQAGLAEPLAFRLRAGDGLSARFQQETVQRIKLARVDYALRYPRYTKMADLAARPLDTRRLSALVGSRFEFDVACDIDAESIDASFEPFQKSAEETKGKLLTREDLLALRGMKKAVAPQRRPLPVTRPSERAGRFRFEVEETGLLRLSARGKNGYPSDELAVVVDAATDAPPRIMVTGIEPETWVAPGESVAYQYRAEDDFAVADVVMGWKTAGTVTTFDFTGEEMIKSKDLGKRIVAGQELVQRQNYPSYEGRPLEFWLTVADSKGQETKTPIFKVHYAQEDYAARVERGLVHLAAIEASAAALKAGLAGIDNRMNILAAVAGQATRWPADKAPVLDDFLKQVRQVGPGGLDLNPQLIGGLPARIERSAAILTAARSMLSTGEDLVAPAEALRTSEDLPKAMADLRAAVQQATTAAELLRKAAGDERNRLLVEGLVQKGLACERRVAALLAKRGNKELFEANLAFVLSQVTALAEAAKPRLADHADEAEPIARLAAAAQGKKAEDSLASLTNLLRTWMSDSPGPAGSFTELQAWMATSAAGAGRDKAAAACETLLASRGRAELFEPQWILALARGAWGAFSAGDLGWTGAKPAAGDALRLAEQLRQDLAAYRLDLLSGRYTLQPDWAADRAAELREQMLAISDLCATAEPRSDFQAGFFATAAYFKSWRLHESLGPRGEALLGAIGQNLHAAPRTLASPAPDPLAASGASLAVAMRRTAEEAEAHAEAIKAFAARTDRPAPETAAAAGVFQAVGRTITRRIEAIEAAGRALTTAWVAARLLRAGPAAPWEEAEHAHAQSLSLTWLALTAREKLVDSHFARTGDVGKWPALYAGTESAARAMAAELRSAAPLVEAGAKPDGGGTASHGDIAGWVTRLNAGGHLEAIKAEHESVAALLAVPRDAKAAAGVLERVKASVLGQSLAASRLAAQAALARLRLRSWEVGPAERIAELKTTAKSLEMLEDRGLQDTLVRAIRAVETSTSAAATQAVNTPPRTATAPTSAPASQPTAAFHDGLAERDRATVEATLDAAVASLSTLARPPAAKALVASARRNLSGIAGLANLADRRWAQRLREAETELVAAMVDAGESSPDAAQALALQASRLWELRARNITQERRGNRGVSALAAEDVVTIRLPKHIEAELTKARNTKSPAAFKEWIEAYYANLYRDLAP